MQSFTNEMKKHIDCIDWTEFGEKFSAEIMDILYLLLPGVCFIKDTHNTFPHWEVVHEKGPCSTRITAFWN